MIASVSCRFPNHINSFYILFHFISFSLARFLFGSVYVAFLSVSLRRRWKVVPEYRHLCHRWLTTRIRSQPLQIQMQSHRHHRLEWVSISHQIGPFAKNRAIIVHFDANEYLFKEATKKITNVIKHFDAMEGDTKKRTNKLYLLWQNIMCFNKLRTPSFHSVSFLNSQFPLS